MDQVLPKVWVTRTLDAGEVPDGVDPVFVFGDGAPADVDGSIDEDVDGSIDEDVDVTWADDANVEEYETFATLADDARQAIEFLETEHDLGSRPLGETLPGHLRRYINE